ncbi:MAG: hypothetical protein ACRDWW_00965, partial [Acidimicrobiales bacterium]
RHGTRCLTAGLEVHTGQVLGLVTPRRPATVFTAFLDLLDTQVPAGRVIHAVVDNLNTHRGPAVAAWQADHPGRLQLHSTFALLGDGMGRGRPSSTGRRPVAPSARAQGL